SEPSYMGAVRAGMLTFSPVRYEFLKNEVVVTKKIVAKITFKKVAQKIKAPVAAARSDSQDYNFYRSITLNKAAFPAFKKQTRTNYELVIADSSYNGALTDFVNFREENGLGVVVKYFSHPTVSDIRSYIQSQYASDDPPKHTLLIGSIDQLPSFRRGEFWQDF